MLELRDVVPLEVLARFGSRIERRREDSPVLDPILEIRDVGRAELEKELPNAPALGSRLECHVQISLANAGTRYESERRLETVADVLPAQRHVPTIVRVINREPTRAGACSDRLVVGAEHI